jgi:hypothetical protein
MQSQLRFCPIFYASLILRSDLIIFLSPKTMPEIKIFYFFIFNGITKTYPIGKKSTQKRYEKKFPQMGKNLPFIGKVLHIYNILMGTDAGKEIQREETVTQ